jgi:hypothetical protein
VIINYAVGLLRCCDSNTVATGALCSTATDLSTVPATAGLLSTGSHNAASAGSEQKRAKAMKALSADDAVCCRRLLIIVQEFAPCQHKDASVWLLP